MDIYAQKEGNIWYFGDEAGIDFNAALPTALTDGEMTTSEGCATIADANGELLFYTDGSTVWNKNHMAMPNGQNLQGNSSSTQSAIILRKPGSVSIYYIFTVDVLSSGGGLRYSEVDITLEGGLGNINNKKNILIESRTCEKVTIIAHQNEKDNWLISQLYGPSKARIHAYLITPAGLSNAPVLSTERSNINLPTHTIGYLKGSLDGSKLVAANTNKGTVELYDFDTQTGKVSNLITLENFTDNKPYGVEFSPNNQLLYIAESSKNAKLYQYDITSGNQATIIASRTIIGSISGFYGALQLAPNNKIYVANDNKEYLSVIQKPNTKGLASNYQEVGFDLKGKKSRRGLPTFNNSVIEVLSNVKIDQKCIGDATTFELTSNIDFDSIRWDFGDLSSTNNTSTVTNPKHRYADSGWYYISAVLSYPTLKDTLRDSVYISHTPIVNLGNDTTLCEGGRYRLFVNFEEANYTWQDGSTGNEYLISTQGRYTVTANLNGCESADSIDVTYLKAPEIELGDDLRGCEGNITITPTISNGQLVQWQDGTTEESYKPSFSGIYWSEARNGDCISRDSVFITIKRFPELEVTYYNSFCEGDSISLNVSPLGYPIEWSTGSTDSTITVKEPGKYSVSQKCLDTLTNGPMVTTNSYFMIVVKISPPDFDLAKDSILCIDKTLTLNAACLYGTYVWNDGSTEDTLTVNIPGQYWVTATNECGTLTDTADVKLKDCTCYLTIAEAFTPNNDNLNETFAPTYISCEFKQYQFDVFNRWGQLIFSTGNYNLKWDGNYRGIHAPQGIYVYVLNYVDQDGVRNSEKGIISLIR